MPDGRSVPFESAEGIIEFDTEPDSVYEISISRAAMDHPTSETGEDTYDPLHYTGPAFTGNIPREERIDVWLGIPSGESDRK